MTCRHGCKHHVCGAALPIYGPYSPNMINNKLTNVIASSWTVICKHDNLTWDKHVLSSRHSHVDVCKKKEIKLHISVK